MDLSGRADKQRASLPLLPFFGFAALPLLRLVSSLPSGRRSFSRPVTLCISIHDEEGDEAGAGVGGRCPGREEGGGQDVGGGRHDHR